MEFPDSVRWVPAALAENKYPCAGRAERPRGGRFNINVSRDQVEAYSFGNPKLIGAKVLFIKRQERLVEYKKYLTDVHEFGNVWYGITGSFRGEQVSVVATGIGPSLVGDAVYALNRPNSTCLYSGTCGGLADGLEIGDYFVADQAVCGDGYSFHLGYAPLSGVWGSPDLLNSLATLLIPKVGRVSNGTVFTTSSAVREVDADFWSIVGKQCRAIEMGAAALYAAAQATGKRAAAYFWVTDLPRRGKSLFEPLAPEDIRTKQDRYNRTASLDTELLARM
jgi:purine-nucleoside phosphorylase